MPLIVAAAVFLILFIGLMVAAQRAPAESGVASGEERELSAEDRWRRRTRKLESGHTVVEVVRRGCEPEQVAKLNPAYPDYELQLREAELRADIKVCDLNRS